jgi:hypothetical protein
VGSSGQMDHGVESALKALSLGLYEFDNIVFIFLKYFFNFFYVHILILKIIFKK